MGAPKPIFRKCYSRNLCSNEAGLRKVKLGNGSVDVGRNSFIVDRHLAISVNCFSCYAMITHVGNLYVDRGVVAPAVLVIL